MLVRNEARSALVSLCENYWYPLYAYLRRRGYPEVGSQWRLRAIARLILGSPAPISDLLSSPLIHRAGRDWVYE
jgi:hypothetical protein